MKMKEDAWGRGEGEYRRLEVRGSVVYSAFILRLGEGILLC